jgi:hypothetical protein
VEITYEVLSASIESFSKYFLLHGQAFREHKAPREKELQNILLLWLQARLPANLISLREVEVGRGRADLIIVAGRALLPIEVKVTEGTYKTTRMVNQLGEYLRSTDVEAGFLVVFERGADLSQSNRKPTDVEYKGRRVRVHTIPVGDIPSKMTL